jgi:hypothetical protein
MNSNGELIDRIVNEVLKRLGSPAQTVRTNGSDGRPVQAILNDRVVTADVLKEKTNGAAAVVVVGPKAVVTPSAWDLARSRNLTIQRDNSAKYANGHQENAAANETAQLIVVNSTSAVDRVLAESGIAATSNDCPDNAAELAADAVHQKKKPVVVFAAWCHRVAMLANRHDKVQASAIENASQVRSIAKQMRPNVWCVDPRPLSFFELRNLIAAVQKS